MVISFNLKLITDLLSERSNKARSEFLCRVFEPERNRQRLFPEVDRLADELARGRQLDDVAAGKLDNFVDEFGTENNRVTLFRLLFRAHVLMQVNTFPRILASHYQCIRYT